MRDSLERFRASAPDADRDRRLIALALLLLLVLVGAGYGTLALTDGDGSTNVSEPPVVTATPVPPSPTPAPAPAPGGDPTTATETAIETPTETHTETPDDDPPSRGSSGGDAPTATATPPDGGEGSLELRADGGTVFVDLARAAPGDGDAASIRLENAGEESGRLDVGDLAVEDEENGLLDPEAAADDDTADEGELSDALEFRLVVADDGTDHHLYGSETGYATLGDVTADGATEGPVLEGGTDVTVTLEWRIPADAGNEIQSDVVAFDLQFALYEVTG